MSKPENNGQPHKHDVDPDPNSQAPTAFELAVELFDVFAVMRLNGHAQYSQFNPEMREEFEQLLKTGGWFTYVENLKRMALRNGVCLSVMTRGEMCAASMQLGKPLAQVVDDRVSEICAELWAEVVRLDPDSQPPGQASDPRAFPRLAASDPAPAPQHVTLDQMAALVNRSKKTIEREMNRPNSAMPRPDVEGGGGKAHEWRWDRVRPWLERTFGRQLPDRFPS